MNKTLTLGQRIVLGLAAVPMVAFGIIGGWGTYTNIMSAFDRTATALGVVAAGEGATLVLAMIMIGRTMLGQSSPLVVRFGLWILPAIAACVCYSTAKTGTEQIVFAVTPLAMCVSAEGLGFLARSIVIYVTGVDMEAQRRNAETLQKISYHQARSKSHPDEKTRNRSAKKVWRIAKKVGVSDNELGTNLIGVQRDRMTQGADSALVQMFGLLSQDSETETLSHNRETGQDTQDRTEELSQDSGTEDSKTETVSQDKKPTVRKTGQKKYSARDYFRDELETDVSLVVSQAYEKAQEKFPEITEANARKAFNRARADLGLN